MRRPGEVCYCPSPHTRSSSLSSHPLSGSSPRPHSISSCRRAKARTSSAKRLASALRRREELIASLSNARHIDRVRETFLRLARDYGKVDGRGVRIDLPLTHELLAEMVCSARETVTRAVDELEREGFVMRERGGYRVAIDAQLLV
jgi:hypothetical protein